MNSARRILALTVVMLVPVLLALAVESLAFMPGPPQAPDAVHLSGGAQGG